jgi:L-ascorbate metabolism protein UlaG (beta-lactamase superfamily)
LTVDSKSSNAPLSTDSDQSSVVTYLGHATVLIEIDGVRILTDPLLRRRTAHLSRPAIEQPRMYVEDIDLILISHMHWDHLDLPSLRMVPGDTPVLAPVGARDVLTRAGLRDITELRPGESRRFGPARVTATPADHDGFRPPFGPYGECVGYLVEGSTSFYFAGDTDLFSEMEAVGKDLDVALLPVWGWGPTLGSGHLDPDSAAEALSRLLPRVAVPIHWGTLCPIGLKWTRPRFLTQPPKDFALTARQVAPDVDVQIIHPGGRLDLNRSNS